MTDLPGSAPAGYAPVAAVVFQDSRGMAVVVDVDHPLLVGEASFGSAVALVPDVEQAPRRGVSIVATTAGTVPLKLTDGGLIDLPIKPGLSILPVAARAAVSAGTTAAVTCCTLT